MRTLILIAGVAMLSACEDRESVAPANSSSVAQTPAAEPAAAAWKLEAGTYEYKRSDGRAGVNTVAADGTYSNALSSGEVETGTWAQEGDLGCFTPKQGDKRCYTFTPPDADGNFTGTMADGTTLTGRKTA